MSDFAERVALLDIDRGDDKPDEPHAKLRASLGAGARDVIDHLAVDAPPCAPLVVNVTSADELVQSMETLARVLGKFVSINCDYNEETIALLEMAGGKHSRCWFGAGRESFATISVENGGSEARWSVYAHGEAQYGPPPPSELDESQKYYPEQWKPSVGGAGTGMRADRLIFDDPIEPPLPRGRNSMTDEQWGHDRRPDGTCARCNADDTMWCDQVAHGFLHGCFDSN